MQTQMRSSLHSESRCSIVLPAQLSVHHLHTSSLCADELFAFISTALKKRKTSSRKKHLQAVFKAVEVVGLEGPWLMN